jgi:hypothetical protein
MTRPSLLTFLTATLLLAAPTPAADREPIDAMGPASVHGGALSIAQCFIQEADAGAIGGPRFLLSGRELAASLETGRVRWLVRDTTGDASLVALVPVGARPGVAPVGERPRPGVVNRFHGSPDAWRTGLSTWSAVRYADLWEGIDLVLEADGQVLKSTYVIAPGADPRHVVWRHHGGEDVFLDDDGSLVVETASGRLVDAAPVAWQLEGGARLDVPVRFSLCEAADGGVDVGYALGAHDPQLPLLIDPATVVQTGFLGGTERDEAAAVAVDASGNVYVGGWARSDENSFPATVGPITTYTPTFSPWGDAFVAKLDPTGTTLLYAGYIGGWEFDFVNDMAVDTAGRAYLTGHTRSTESDGFPVMGGPDTTQNGGIDGWVARVSADGTSLEYCGFIGGTASEDRAFGIDVDSSGRAYVAGRASSDQFSFPVTVGPDLILDGSSDAFVARLASDGLSFEYCGYIGGANNEDGSEIVCDDAGNAWVGGLTYSDELSFPVAVGPDLTFNGGPDAFVARIDATGSSLLWCGYLGGSGSEFVNGMDRDAAGDLYIAGHTSSLDFPVLVGPGLTPLGNFDGYVAKIKADGTAPIYAGVIAGSSTDIIKALAVDDDGGAWVAGLTFTEESHPVPLPLTDMDVTYNGGGDGFVARVLPSGAGLDFAGYVGGSGNDDLLGLALVPSGLTPGVTEAWVVGHTLSTEATLPAVGGFDTTHNGQQDGLIVHVQRTPPSPWSDEGCALAGIFGDPRLFGNGPLSDGSNNSVDLFSAAPSATAGLFLALSSASIPFKGGTLKPFPFFNPVILSTSPAGTIPLPFVMPPAIPADTELWVQWAIQDAAAIHGVSLSNALLGVTP